MSEHFETMHSINGTIKILVLSFPFPSHEYHCYHCHCVYQSTLKHCFSESVQPANSFLGRLLRVKIITCV